jgi:histone-lysine N-methyltransferase SETD2
MNKYKAKIPRDDLKRFAKEIAKKLVESDFKGGRVEDPTKISEKHQQKVKKHCKDFFDKAAYKHSKHEKEKAARRAKSAHGTKPDVAAVATATSATTSPRRTFDASPEMDVQKEHGSDDDDVKMSEDEPDEDEQPGSASPLTEMRSGETLKRKRSRSLDRDPKEEDDLTKSPLKKLNLDSPPPPPPPPPPAPPVETPDGTPGQSEDASPAEMSLGAGTSFTSKSMADVLAEAQQDPGDDADVPMEGASPSVLRGLRENGIVHEEEMLHSGLVGGPVAERWSPEK